MRTFKWYENPQKRDTRLIGEIALVFRTYIDEYLFAFFDYRWFNLAIYCRNGIKEQGNATSCHCYCFMHRRE